MKNALIIGVTGGLGKAISIKFLEEGYEIWGTYYSNELNGLGIKNEKVHFYQLDMGNRESIKKLSSELSGIEFDFLVNTSSGNFIYKKFETLGIEDFENRVKSDIVNYFYLIQEFSSRLRSGAGIIFVLSESIATKVPPKYLLPYVSVKYALLGMMKSLSLEMANKKIRVNAVSPGMMDTRFIKDLPAYVKEKYIKENRHGKLTSPQEVAEVIFRLISDETITGINEEVY